MSRAESVLQDYFWSAYSLLSSFSDLQDSTGLHASISTHICHDDFNQTTGEWVSPQR